MFAYREGCYLQKALNAVFARLFLRVGMNRQSASRILYKPRSGKKVA